MDKKQLEELVVQKSAVEAKLDDCAKIMRENALSIDPESTAEDLDMQAVRAKVSKWYAAAELRKELTETQALLTQQIEAAEKVAPVVAKTDMDQQFMAFLQGRDGEYEMSQVGDQRGFLMALTADDNSLPTVAGQVSRRLQSFAGVRQAARSLRSEQGQMVSIPTIDDTGEGQLVAIGADTADARNAAAKGVLLHALRYTSGPMGVPNEYLRDTAISTTTINNVLVDRVGRAQNNDMTIGAGSAAAPQGAVDGAPRGATTAASGTVSLADLYSLVASVDEAYLRPGNAPVGDRFRTDAGIADGRVAFMMPQSALFAILADAVQNARHPIWTPSLSDGTPATLLGYPVYTNNHMAAVAAGSKSVLFGNFDSYTVRDVGGLLFQVFNDSAFAKNNETGLQVWSFADGRYTNGITAVANGIGTTEAVKHLLTKA